MIRDHNSRIRFFQLKNHTEYDILNVSIRITSVIVGVLLVAKEVSLSAWLTLLARSCEFVSAILIFFKEVDYMRNVLVMVGKGVSGVSYADMGIRDSSCIGTPL